MLCFPQADTVCTHLGLQYTRWGSTLCVRDVPSLLRLCHSDPGCVSTFLRMLRLQKPTCLLFRGHLSYSSYLGTNILGGWPTPTPGMWCPSAQALTAHAWLWPHVGTLLILLGLWFLRPGCPSFPMWMHYPLHLGVDIIQPTVSPKERPFLSTCTPASYAHCHVCSSCPTQFPTLCGSYSLSHFFFT